MKTYIPEMIEQFFRSETTISSDTSDVEGRIELLTQKLADRRVEMARLKKEARKQAKRRLKALEANLLTQIKVSCNY